MFGYVIANKAEMKFKEYDIYQSYYCGLCKSLKERGGNLSRLSLSYDMTFVYMLLTALYEPESNLEPCKCAVHPFEKRIKCTNEYVEYVADMSLVLTYYKCKDDWADDKKCSAKGMLIALSGKYGKVAANYPDKVKRIGDLMEELTKMEEKNSQDMDTMAGLFGRIMAEIMVCREDEWAPGLSRTGFFLGKFIYLMDAYEDIAEDIKKGRYNPLKKLYETPDFEGQCQQILTMMIAECCREFEKLPIVLNIEILRNILYSGVWVRYQMVSEKRKEGHQHE